MQASTLERIPIIAVALSLMIVNLLQRIWLSPLDQNQQQQASTSRPLFLLINGLVFVSSICLCSSSSLSCFASFAASPDQLADNALLYAELLRNTSSAALLCILITVEYQTLFSFSKFLRFKVSSETPALPSFVLPLHWVVGVGSFLVAWIATIAGSVSNEYSYRGMFLLYLACITLLVLVLVMGVSMYIFWRVDTASGSTRSSSLTGSIADSNYAAALLDDEMASDSSQSSCLEFSSSSCPCLSAVLRPHDPIARFKRFVLALLILIPTSTTWQLVQVSQAFASSRTWSPNVTPTIYSPLILVTLLGNALAIWFVWQPFRRADHNSRPASPSIDSRFSTVTVDAFPEPVVTFQVPASAIAPVETPAAQLALPAQPAHPPARPPLRTESIVIGATAASTATPVSAMPGGGTARRNDSIDVSRPFSRRRDDDEEESAGIGRVSRGSRSRIVYNADAISGRTGAVDIRVNGPASLSSSVMGTSFMSLNQSTAANSLIDESFRLNERAEKALSDVKSRFSEVQQQLQVISQKFTGDDDNLIVETTKLSREQSRLEPLVAQINDFHKLKSEISDLKSLVQSKDKEIAEMARDDLDSCEQKLIELENSIVNSLVPHEDADERSAIVEVRAGTGGLEASLFAAALYSMYEKYAVTQGWRFERMSYTESDVGGVREASFSLTGSGVFGKLKHEAGVHRVQRVPATETAGRVHTSTATVAILPEAQEVDVKINERDLKIEVFRARGAGGQSVNKTESAVRLTHVPTGLTISMQDERSQHQNKAKAMRMLQSKLYQQSLEKQRAERSANRMSQVGGGDRHERIRTYNYPQGRVTDHRINVTKFGMDSMMSGGDVFSEFVDDLQAFTSMQALSELYGIETSASNAANSNANKAADD